MLASVSEEAPPSIRDLKQLIAERRIDFPTLLEQAMRLLLSKPEIIALPNSVRPRRCGFEKHALPKNGTTVAPPSQPCSPSAPARDDHLNTIRDRITT